MKGIKKKQCVVVLVTCPNRVPAKRLAAALVSKRLAACVNIVPGLESLFRWDSKMDRAKEVLLIIKTTAKRLPALQRAVLALHPYDVPEIIALPIIAGHPPYLRWLRDSVHLP